MNFKRPSSRRPRIPLEFVLTAVAVLTCVGWYIKDRPVRLDTRPEALALAVAEPSTAGAPVLVVLPSVAEAATLETFSWDATWLNAVEQEVGQTRSILASALSRSDMDPCEWVIIPRHAAQQIDPTQAQFVRTWVEDGGVLLLEQPEGPWQAFTGQNLTGARRADTRRITAFDGAMVRGELREDIISMPLVSTLLTYNPADLARGRDYDVLLEVDGQPGIIRRALGRGHVIVLLFDASQALGLMQQGVPQDDLTLPAIETAQMPPGLSALVGLVANEGLHAASVPYADLLERNLLYLLDEQRPVARLWLYPGKARGAFVVSHSEARFGERLRFMTDWEHSIEQRSTVFSVPGSLPPESLADIGRIGTDLQMQWIPAEAPFAPITTWGMGGFRPLFRAMTLQDQVSRLNHDLLPYGPTIVTRTMDGLWPINWLDGFRRLEAAGVVADSSFGPAPPSLTAGQTSIGYLFGTGYPFRPIDANGHRFRVMEIPYQILDAAQGYSIDALRRLIFDSADGHHTAIVGDWRPDTMAVRPSFDALEGWRAAFALAEEQELWVTTHAEFVDFMQRRRASSVRSTFQREQRTLSIEVTLSGPAPDARDVLSLTPSIAFAARLEGRPVERITVNGAPVDVAELPVTGDRALHLLQVEPGEHRIQVFYTSPTETMMPFQFGQPAEEGEAGAAPGELPDEAPTDTPE